MCCVARCCYEMKMNFGSISTLLMVLCKSSSAKWRDYAYVRFYKWIRESNWIYYWPSSIQTFYLLLVDKRWWIRYIALSTISGDGPDIKAIRWFLPDKYSPRALKCIIVIVCAWMSLSIFPPRPMTGPAFCSVAVRCNFYKALLRK
jgi:hypothetical protein